MQRVRENIRWPEFMNDQDLVWDRMPDRWEEAPFVGSGIVGSMMYADTAENRIRFWVCRSDVGRLDYPGHFMDPIRIQIGSLDFTPLDKIVPEQCHCRLDLWNAEVSGVLVTMNGEIKWRLFAPSGDNIVVLHLESKTCQWSWKPSFIPDGNYEEKNGTCLFIAEDYLSHPRTQTPSGGFAVAWREYVPDCQNRYFIFSVSATPVNRKQWNKTDSGAPAEQEVLESIENFDDKRYRHILDKHRSWWHDYYKKSFFSISDRELESFYWIQLYKFASSSRPDFPLLDNHGVWSVEKPYGFATWDYNVQSTYRLHLTANHGDFGKPLLTFLEENFNNETMFNTKYNELRGGMRQQVFLRYRFFDTDYWEHSWDTPCDGPAKYLWGCHNYWLHYLHSQEESMLPRLLIMLEGGLNAMKAGMEMENGRLVIPSGYSWESWKGKNPTGLLAVFKWALKTVIAIGKNIDELHPMIPQWENWMESMTDYPQGPEGFYLGEGKPPVSHRHWTQLMMVFPLDILNLEDPYEKELAIRSVDTWANLSAGLDGQEAKAFASVAAIQLYAKLGLPDRIPQLSDIYLHTRCTWAPGVWPGTMYREYGPVMETPLFFANALQECCLQTGEDGIRVFPAVPASWPNITFHDWHAGGNFLVSAKRERGSTCWLRIVSLSGKKQRIYIDFTPDETAYPGIQYANGYLDIYLQQGEEVFITNNEWTDFEVSSVEYTSGQKNAFGINSRFFSTREIFSDKSKPLINCL